MPLSELLPTAPDIYTVKTRDTLWDISKMYLKSPWRWPELWGMNLEQVRNPHLIFPGQVLFLDKSNGRARLRMGAPVGGAGDAGLSPRVRSKDIAIDGIASIPFNLIEPFLNEAVIFETNELATAPRIVATQEGRVLLSRGDTAYVRGDLGPEREYRIFREPRPLRDPTTKEILGYEATYVGASEYTVQGETRTDAAGQGRDHPGDLHCHQHPPGSRRRRPPGAGAGARVHQLRAAPAGRADLGPDRLDLRRRADRRPEPDRRPQPRRRRRHRARPRAGALPRRQGGRSTRPRRARPKIKLPDERHGVLFVFRVFSRMSYALILSVKEPVSPGDRFTQP